MIWIITLGPIAFLGMLFVLYHAIYKSIMKNATKGRKGNEHARRVEGQLK